MARSTSSGAARRHGPGIRTRAGRTLAFLFVLIAGLAGLNWFTVASEGGQWLPKLALDLEGGTQIVLSAQLPEGQADPSPEQMQQAVSIIRQRIDAAGVAEAEITTQGGRNIVVSVPGEMDEQTRKRIQNSAKLEFRPVLYAASQADSQILPPDQVNPDPVTTPTAQPTDPSDPVQITEAMQQEFTQFNCATDIRPASEIDPAEPLLTCNEEGTEKYILGPVEISGADIADAVPGREQTSTGAVTNKWAVNLRFNEQGTAQFAAVTQRLYALQAQDPQRNRFAVTLDNLVIIAPSTNAVITDGRSQISGDGFTEESVRALADQLKFGALPFNFVPQSDTTVSATLGTAQLRSGLVAGLIGLALVVLYSLVQYRVLGLVTIASLAIAASVTYLVVTYLSNQEGYRLSLAGVIGLIVAIGITADSFIVYFERIKDELRDGRTLVSAVEVGWSRASRTILVSDAVNFLVSVVLFFIAVGNVRGFALTLGITTLIDLVVVAFFTHPVMRLLAHTRFFGEGHPLSGLDPRALGAVYRGRGTFRTPSQEAGRGARREAERRQSLAERRAARAQERPGRGERRGGGGERLTLAQRKRAQATAVLDGDGPDGAGAQDARDADHGGDENDRNTTGKGE